MAGLIADIGGTNARFAIADDGGIHSEDILKCADYPGLVEAAQAYLKRLKCPVPKQAVFAVAGPVTGDRFDVINNAWSFSVAETKSALGLERLALLNDFEAIALSVPYLKPEDIRQIGGGKAKPQAPVGVIGPGTGLGVASLFWDGTHYRAAPGEGGHVTMPAKTQREFDVFQTLLKAKYSHISAERVCSGKGLVNIYNALRILEDSLDRGHNNHCVPNADMPDRTPEDISAAALDKSCPLCVEALDMMLGFLGSVAGNLALTLGAHGGIYIAGGIATQLGDYFGESRFYEEFLTKGRFKGYLEPVPVSVILHPFPAFIGLQTHFLNMIK